MTVHVIDIRHMCVTSFVKALNRHADTPQSLKNKIVFFRQLFQVCNYCMLQKLKRSRSAFQNPNFMQYSVLSCAVV